MTSAEIRSGGAAPGKGAGWIGSIAHTPLAEVFQRIVQEGRSGDLQVTLPDAIKTVYFDRGFVVLASSNLKDDRLGESMIEAGRISRKEFALASMVVKATERKFGETLVAAGIISEEEMGHHVARQVNRIVLSLFSGQTGMYSFDERPCTVPIDLMVSLSVYRILLEGVRRMTRKKLVLAGLPARETRLTIAAHPPFNLDPGQLRPVEKDVLRVADGATIATIAETLGGEEGVVLRAVYGLLSAGVLETALPEAPRRPLRVQEETGTFVLSEIRRKVHARAEALRPDPVPPVKLSPDPATPPEELELDYAPPEPRWEPIVEPAPAEDEEPPGPPEPRWQPIVEAAEEERAPPPEPVAAQAPSPESERRFPPSGRVAFEPVEEGGWLRTGLRRLGDRVERALLRWVGSNAADIEASLDLAPPAPPPPAATSMTPEEASAPPPQAAREAPVPLAKASDDADVGVPEWSILSTPEEREEASPVKAMDENVGVPSWSLRGEPDEPAVEARDEEFPVETMSALDNELFIEAEAVGDDAPSMLSHIPVEEIEVQVELEEQPFEGFSEDAESVEVVTEELDVTPSDDAPVIAVREIARAEESEVAEISSPVSPTELPGGESSYREQARANRADAMIRAKQSGGEQRLLRDVRLHFKLQDWEGAVPLLEQLIQISPGSPLYRGMLARAMSRHPMMRKDAEEHFIEALRLAPQDAELHYWFGLYYKSFGLKARADTEFRTALRIDPRHQGARAQLTGGGRKDDGVGVFKKLFG